MGNFIGRKKELEFLEDRYSSGKSELIVIYGRRSAEDRGCKTVLSGKESCLLYIHAD